MWRYLLAAIVVAGAVFLPPRPAAAMPSAQTDPCQAAVSIALSEIGKGYEWGAKGPNKFDCSGLTYWSYSQGAGMNIGLGTADQSTFGVAVACTLDDLAGNATTCWHPGDLIFLRYPGGRHVALYAGSGLFIDAYNTSTGVIIHDVSGDSFYRAHFWQARRPASCANLPVDLTNVPTTTPTGDPLSDFGIPDLVGYVSFSVPYYAVSCEPEPSVVWTDPGSPIRWLAWRISSLFAQLICFLLSIAQFFANVAATGLNMIAMAVNAFWRLAVGSYINARDAFYALWELLDQLRLIIPSLAPALQQFAAFMAAIWSLFLLAIELAGQAAMLLLSIAGSLLGLIGWIGAIILGPMLTILAAFTGTDTPAQFGTHPLYAALHGSGRALVSSDFGWAMVLFWALCYVAFIFWAARFLSESR